MRVAREREKRIGVSITRALKEKACSLKEKLTSECQDNVPEICIERSWVSSDRLVFSGCPLVEIRKRRVSAGAGVHTCLMRTCMR